MTNNDNKDKSIQEAKKERRLCGYTDTYEKCDGKCWQCEIADNFKYPYYQLSRGD